MSEHVEPPALGTPEHEWWRAGLHAEAAARKAVPRSDAGRQALDCVEVLSRVHQEMDGVDIGVWLISVFSAPHTLRDRIRITRRIWKRLR